MSRGGHRGIVGASPDFSGSAPNVEGGSGEYWTVPYVRTTVALTAGVMYTHMVYVPRSCTVDRIGAAVTVGAVGSTLTLGIYEDDGAGNPGVLLLDAGTIDGNSATAQEITISQALRGGRRYHLAALCAGGTPTVRAAISTSGGFVGRTSTLAFATGTSLVLQVRSRASIVGTALPTPAATTGLASTHPIVTVRLA